MTGRFRWREAGSLHPDRPCGVCDDAAYAVCDCLVSCVLFKTQMRVDELCTCDSREPTTSGRSIKVSTPSGMPYANSSREVPE